MADDNSEQSDRYQQFLRLFLENDRRLYAFIVSILPNLTDAEDVLQETCVVLWEKFDDFTPGTNFLAWGCRIAHFKVLKFLERQYRGPLRFTEATLDAIAADAIQMTQQVDARHQALAECMNKLDKKDRDILRRRYQKDATARDVASQLGRSASAIYKSLSRIHDSLFDCIRRKVAKGGTS